MNVRGVIESDIFKKNYQKLDKSIKIRLDKNY
jgi:hypothetical protein